MDIWVYMGEWMDGWMYAYLPVRCNDIKRSPYMASAEALERGVNPMSTNTSTYILIICAVKAKGSRLILQSSWLSFSSYFCFRFGQT